MDNCWSGFFGFVLYCRDTKQIYTTAGHALRLLSETRTPKNKNKIEYNLWRKKKKNLNYKLIKSFGECKKKKSL